MASAIGIRVYQITVRARGDQSLMPLDAFELAVTVPDFIAKFIVKHDSVVQNSSLERSWYFEERERAATGSSQGYVHYGTFGFESNFVDTKTLKHNYRRQVTDVEEIPLFYEFWCPDDSDFGLVAFQSFQGRSCISLVLSSMKDEFESYNPDYLLIFKKLMPNDARGSAYYSAPVKKLRLIKRKASGDIADNYFENPTPDLIDFEIVISARRRSNLGPLSSVLSPKKGGPKSVITHAGIDFPEAVAEVLIGKKTRRVGILGLNGDAGVVDLTDVITRGSDGHPTFDSLAKESDLLLKDFHSSLKDSEL